MVPVSVRRPGERGALNNQVSAVFVDLPVGLPDPMDRLAAIRGQMDEYKKTMQAVDARSIIAMGDYVAPTLLSHGGARRPAGRPVLVPGGDDERARPPDPALRARQADGLRARLRPDRRWHPLLDRHLLVPEHDDLRDQRRLRRLPRRRRPRLRHPARPRRAAHDRGWREGGEGRGRETAGTAKPAKAAPTKATSATATTAKAATAQATPAKAAPARKAAAKKTTARKAPAKKTAAATQ